MYEELARVYEFLIPEGLAEPEAAAAAFAGVLAELPPRARVLDCAAGTGELAVGLALRGFEVAATDASEPMLARARALAEARGVELETHVRSWNSLAQIGWDGRFDAVLCIGNSLAHAGGAEQRRTALAAMAGVLAPGGLLVLTSRNWEWVRARRSRLEVEDRLVERGGRRAVVVRSWWLREAWEEPHGLEVAVALIGDAGEVETITELLAFWPFTERDLEADLRAAGLEPAASSYAPDVDRYLVTAQRPGAGADAGSPRPAA